MLKVNEEQILADYLALSDKKEKGLAAVATDAKNYAVAHGYSDEQTEKFVSYVQEIQGSGLSEKELSKLEVLGSYIEEVPDETETELEKATLATGVAASGVVTNI